MRRILFSRPDGGVSIMHPLAAEGEAEAQAEQRAWDKLPADAIAPTFVDAAAIPADRSQRRAWRQNGAAIVVDAAAITAGKDADAIAAIDGIDLLQFEHLFELENRTRLLEARAVVTRAQYRNALIARWKELHP